MVEISVDPRTDEALRLLRRERDELLLAVADLRGTLLAIGRVAIDSRETEVYRLSRVATLATVGLRTGRGVERRTWGDRVRAWWQRRRA